MSADRDESARRQARTITIRRRSLVALVLASGATLAILALVIGVMVTAAGSEPPPFLIVALALVFVVSAALSLVRNAGFYVRRTRRRRRLRGARAKERAIKRPPRRDARWPRFREERPPRRGRNARPQRGDTACASAIM
jgi:hypothetical protein